MHDYTRFKYGSRLGYIVAYIHKVVTSFAQYLHSSTSTQTLLLNMNLLVKMNVCL